MGAVEYNAKNRYLRSEYTEVSPEEFYKEIFPLDEMENKNDPMSRSSNPIFTILKSGIDADGKKKSFFQNEIVFADHFTESLEKTTRNNLALCSCCSYSGRRKFAKNAFRCHGFIIDLDGVGKREVQDFFGWVDYLEKIPRPTFTVNSGNGMHIYYIFENPVPLYPNVVQHLQELKRGLTNIVWNKETSAVKERQFQGIYQSFRMIGSRAKMSHKYKDPDRYLVRAYKTGPRTTIEHLNKFVEEEYKCPENPDYSSWEWRDGEHLSLEECRLHYPDWYQRRIVNKESPNQWKCNRRLYDWWYRQIQTAGNAYDGNRYHCVAMLYVYGQKCMLSKDLITADAMNLLELYNGLTVHEDNHFTEKDIKDASKFYGPKYVKLTKKEIERRTGIKMPEGIKRNGLEQKQHLYLARRRKEDMKMIGLPMKNPEGRPKGSSQQRYIVQRWRRMHPEGRKVDCIKETGFSKPTVYRWWDDKED